MAYNEKLADRVRELIAAREDRVEEKLMFGGLTFMVNDKICVGVKSDRILVRIDPNIYDQEALGDAVTPMIHSGREMKGFLFVGEEVVNTRGKLKRWVDLALEYNPKAQAAGKKKAVKKR
ncbi:MAG TPA: TfoX/Sxy family protein [Puia sp.]|jgi:TfoX/Sxy family transcriptional regulator of competence genes|nr:TfoX/Sxy family protein [Puia sp.]